MRFEPLCYFCNIPDKCLRTQNGSCLTHVCSSHFSVYDSNIWPREFNGNIGSSRQLVHECSMSCTAVRASLNGRMRSARRLRLHASVRATEAHHTTLLSSMVVKANCSLYILLLNNGIAFSRLLITFQTGCAFDYIVKLS